MKIYLVTNRHIVEGDYLNKIEDACRAGIDRIILREKDLRFNDYYSLAKEVKTITDRYEIPLIINGNIDVAKKIKSYGYHSSYNDFIKFGKLYSVQGVSIHNVLEAIDAERLGADYILAGHIFETNCKKGVKPRGINFLEKLRENIEIPVVAIGGINSNNVYEIYDSQLYGFAVMSYIMASKNGELSTKNLKDSLKIVIGR